MREVEFLLTAKADPAAQQVIRDFGQSIANAQQGIQDGPQESFADKIAAETATGNRLAKELQIKHQGEMQRLREAGFGLEEEFNAKRLAASNRIAQAVAAVERQMIQGGEASADSLRELAEATQEGASIAIEQELRIAEARRQSASKERETRRNAQNQRKQDEREQAQSLSEYQKNIDQANGAGRELLQSFAETSESVMKLARGMVFFGLTGETELQKVQDALLTMQGTIDLTVGGTKLLLGMEKAMRLFNTATIAATAAQEALNAARLKGATISSVEGAAQLTGLGGMAARGGAAMMRGANVLAGGLAGVGVASVGAGAAGTAAAGLAALGGAAFGVTSAFQMLKEAAKTPQGGLFGTGIGGGATPGSTFENIGSSSYNPFAQLMTGGNISTVRGQGQVLDKQLTQQQIKVQQIAEYERQRADVQQTLTDRMRAQYELTAKTWDLSRTGLDDQEQLASIAKEITGLQKAASSGNETAAARILSLREQELSLSQRIADQQRTMAQEMIAANREALSTVEQRIAAEEEATQSAAVRFGLMDEANQQEIVMLRERLAAGQQLSAQELGRLRGLSQEIDAEIELQALRRAQAAGFDRLGIAQASERRQGALESMREMLSVELESSIDFSVQIQSNAEATAQAVTAQIRQLYDRDIGSIATRVADLTKEVANIDARIQRRANGG